MLPYSLEGMSSKILSSSLEGISLRLLLEFFLRLLLGISLGEVMMFVKWEAPDAAPLLYLLLKCWCGKDKAGPREKGPDAVILICFLCRGSDEGGGIR